MKFSVAANAAESLRFEGNTAVRDIALIDATTLAPFAKWAELSSTNIKVVLGAQDTEVQLSDLLLDQPRARMKAPAANEPLLISFTDARVQMALDELAAGLGADATKLRAQCLPPAGNAMTGLLQTPVSA